MGPQLFFSRGFRCFGYAITLDPIVPNAEKGQQAGLVADLDGDGVQDCALVLLDGELSVAFGAFEQETRFSVVAELPLGGPCVGPVTVTGWQDKRCLGAWNVAAGSSKAFFGLTAAGPCLMRWSLPGGEPQRKEVIAEREGKSVSFAIRQ
jgi:hypothetical protein